VKADRVGERRIGFGCIQCGIATLLPSSLLISVCLGHHSKKQDDDTATTAQHKTVLSLRNDT